MSAHRVIAFLKAPRPGSVKARLASELDAEAAAAIARVLIDRSLAELRPLAKAGVEVEVRVTPDDAIGEVQHWCPPGWRLCGQGPGDLGARLRNAFAAAFTEGAQRAVVIRTDCPGLTAEDILDAFTGLAAHDIVLGPAQDGGYWIVGLHARQDRVFEEIPWSTSAVFENTRARAEEAGLSVRVLNERSDIENLEDWRHWLRSQTL